MTLFMLRLAPPVFVTLTVCAALVVPITWLEKVKLDGERDTAAGVVPVNGTDCGLPPALSVMVNAPVTLLVVCGVKLMLTEQLAPAARVPVQVLVIISKGRLAAMLLIPSATPPVLVTVIA